MNLIDESILDEIKENWVQRHFDEQQRDLFIETLHGRDEFR